MTNYTIDQFAEGNTTYEDFVEDNIEMLQRSERSFIVCSKEDIPPTVCKKDDKGDIWVALISEL